MIDITDAYVDSLAPNSSAIQNARGLVKKKNFVRLNRSEDEVLLFGECSGSGSSNYACSADFAVPEKPVLRCSCPSRQLPCKHALGLLYAYSSGKEFTTAPIPEDLAAKRERAEKREEQKAKKAAEPAEQQPRKINKTALKKKIKTQLEGLDLLEKLTQSLVRGGLATIDRNGIKNMQEHAKQMGNYYLTGAQTMLRQLALYLASDNREANYSHAIELLTRIHAVIKKGRAHLTARLEDSEMAHDRESTIEEWLGHAWQLTELKEAGLSSDQEELVQLAFYSYDDQARQEYVDLGYWVELSSGRIHRTQHFRPYKAAKLMREEDSFFETVAAKPLYRYPGGVNRRIRFDSYTARPVTGQDWSTVSAQSERSIASGLKTVKNELKDPLGDKNPVMLLHASQLRQTNAGRYAMTDGSGEHLEFSDIIAAKHSTISLLPLLPASYTENVTMLVMFSSELDTGRLSAQPLSVIQGGEMIRLLY